MTHTVSALRNKKRKLEISKYYEIEKQTSKYHMSQKEIWRKILKYFELNETKNTAYQDLWHTLKQCLGRNW